MNDYKKLLTVVLLFLAVASFVSAQNRTKVGQLYLGASFEKNFPASYQPQFLAYLAEPGVSPHPNRSRDAFIKLQNGAADGEIDYQDDPDDNTTVTKLITFHDHRLTSILYMLSLIHISTERLAEVYGGGIGISNVHERLRLLYGDQFKMDIRSQEGQGTQIHIEIPELATSEPFAGLLE